MVVAAWDERGQPCLLSSDLSGPSESSGGVAQWGKPGTAVVTFYPLSFVWWCHRAECPEGKVVGVVIWDHSGLRTTRL